MTKNREEDAEIQSFCVMVILCHFRFLKREKVLYITEAS